MKYYAGGKNGHGKNSWSLKALAEDIAELRIMDVIGWPWIEAMDVIRALDQITENKILVRINSPGGDVMDGNAIFNALRDHHAKVETRVEGLAASIASVIALAGDKVVMQENAFMMIHNSWTFAMGGAADLEHTAAVLRKIDDNLIATYKAKTGLSAEELSAMTDAETWMTADEAVDFGFADEVKAGSDDTANARRKVFDLSEFKKVPDSVQAEFGKDLPIAKRDAERALRDAGVGKVAAKVIVSHSYGRLAGREAVVSNDQRDADGDLLAAAMDVAAKTEKIIEEFK